MLTGFESGALAFATLPIYCAAGSENSDCGLGTDCDDCGPRAVRRLSEEDGLMSPSSHRHITELSSSLSAQEHGDDSRDDPSTDSYASHTRRRLTERDALRSEQTFGIGLCRMGMEGPFCEVRFTP